MLSFLIPLLECSISMTVIGILYMVVTPFLQNRFTAKGSYYAWLVVVIGFIVPFRFHLPVSIISVDTLFPFLSNADPSAFNSEAVALPKIVIAAAFPWHRVALGVWLVGVVLFVIWHVIRHRHLLRLIRRWSEKATDRQALNLIREIQAELNITRHVDLRICPAIPSPMLVGIVHPVILLPSNRLSIQALRFILKHELIHLKRGDLSYKLLVFAATAMHWFNPFVYRMAREISLQCELSCDEEVIKFSDTSNRQKYVEAIIGVTKKQVGRQSVFSSSFSDGRLSMKNRVFSIMDTRSKKWGISLLLFIVLAVAGTGAVLKLSPTKPDMASESIAEREENKSSVSLADPAVPSDHLEEKLDGVTLEPDASVSSASPWLFSMAVQEQKPSVSASDEEKHGEGTEFYAITWSKP